MRRLTISPSAFVDLKDIGDFIAASSPAAAARVMRKIETRMLQLLDHPELGPKRDDVRQNTRMLVLKPHLIFYEVKDDEIVVLRCVDGRRHASEWL